jgi:hypothetical protein
VFEALFALYVIDATAYKTYSLELSVLQTEEVHRREEEMKDENVERYTPSTRLYHIALSGKI